MLFALSASYTQQAIAAMVKNPTDREAAARQLCEKMGARLIGWYGLPSSPDGDGLGFMVIYDAPAEAHFAILTAGGASGVFHNIKSQRLMDSQQFQQACRDATRVNEAFRSPLTS